VKAMQGKGADDETNMMLKQMNSHTTHEKIILSCPHFVGV